MWIAIIASIISIIIVFYLSILTLNKGYGYKQTVDPLPEEVEKHSEKNQEREQ